MGLRWTFAILAAGTAAPALSSSLAAQEVAVPRPEVPRLVAFAENDLVFGTVLPGVPVSVSVQDHRHSGQFVIEGPPGASVRVDFVLPTALTTESGARLPIAFGPGDGFADFSRGRPPRGLSFDPHLPVIGMVGPNGRLFLRLGGSVLPGRPQTAGVYRASIFLTVYDLGT